MPVADVYQNTGCTQFQIEHFGHECLQTGVGCNAVISYVIQHRLVVGSIAGSGSCSFSSRVNDA